jgi:LmbE family N-acetylglucosaminyl deacetylase
VAFGAHPDDVEFGCGVVVAVEIRAGRPAQGLRTTFPWVFWGFHGKYKIFI